MKVITITNRNIKEICGKMKKFFYNNNKTGFISWHNFSCGFKHISPMIELDGSMIRVEHTYPAPRSITLSRNNKIISVSLTATDAFGLKEGDKIAFCGNRIITRQNWGFIFGKEKQYLYTVFQVLPMEKEKQNRLHTNAENEAAEYEEEYYKELEEEYKNSSRRYA